ncbi:MAG TPA: malate dehydrogenase [candidate division Zixibacteria bacterium]|nr:malate dehydrogenase [candidate division Zixibacteria bacterium]HPM37266.1 malate dehydrogenase [candidate division Zixibacteria bacterium]
MNRKIAVVGAGNVGASCAMYLAEANLADVAMVDIIEGLPQGKGLDLSQAGPVRGYNAMIDGSNDMAAVKGADIVVMTAGLARKPGMTREDLLTKNAEIVGGVAKEIKKHAPKAYVIVVSNPLDLMTYHMMKVTGFPKERVIGQAGVLDSTRFRTFVAMELGVAMADVQAMVLGGHGDTMVPLSRYTTVAGIPIGELIPKERIKAIEERTANGGGEIVKLLKTGSAYYAPAAATVQMVRAILNDEKRLLPCSCYLTGEYGIEDMYIGVPCILGAKGVEKILELKLNKAELTSLQKSAATYKEHMKIMGY